MFKNKTLLIVGGTGSFGNAVLNRFMENDIGEIRIFSRDEKKQDDMRKKIQNEKVTFFIGDVRNKQSLYAAMKGADFVFNAAALKQVPSCEFFPMEALQTNVVGTSNVLELGSELGVKKVVCLSTDKAVYPINAMGISKAMMEKVMIAKARTSAESTIITGTRYGNVMASRGSVIPLFLEQIQRNEPLTITDGKMTRYLMTLKDAVELVLFAFSNGKPGDIFVQKAPASTIDDLATSLCEIFGVERKVKYIGTRHGEKLFESLLTREESANAVDLGEYYRIPADNRNLNYEKYFTKGQREEGHDYNSHNARRLDVSELKKELLKLQCVQNALQAK